MNFTIKESAHAVVVTAKSLTQGLEDSNLNLQTGWKGLGQPSGTEVGGGDWSVTFALGPLAVSPPAPCFCPGVGHWCTVARFA